MELIIETDQRFFLPFPDKLCGLLDDVFAFTKGASAF